MSLFEAKEFAEAKEAFVLYDVFEESVQINAPVEFCYQHWKNFSNYPAFMSNLKSVTQVSDTVWRWDGTGQHGDPVSWYGILSQDIPNRLVSWTGVKGPPFEMQIGNSFTRMDAEHTDLTSQVKIFLPKNPIGRVLEDLYGMTRLELGKVLQSFKRFVEQQYQNQWQDQMAD